MKSLRVLLCCLTPFFAGCSKWSFDSYWNSEGYRLIAIDVRSQMCLIFDQDGGRTLIEPTIFAVGANAKYVVIQQHPAIDQWAGKIDRSITNYFVVERRSGGFAERKAGIRGPLNKAEFDLLGASLSLPQFSTTFEDLK